MALEGCVRQNAGKVGGRHAQLVRSACMQGSCGPGCLTTAEGSDDVVEEAPLDLLVLQA